MTNFLNFNASISDGEIIGLDIAQISSAVMESKNLVILKNVYSEHELKILRTAVHEWGNQCPPANEDHFKSNYHRKRAMVSRVQQAPHVFHDFNFNDIGSLNDPLKTVLSSFFTPLNNLYRALTGNIVDFLEIPDSGPYVHPQIIQYPNGGGFFARHWHSLTPQRLGFIVLLSKPGVDFKNGGTVFEINGEAVSVGERHDIGDILIWRYDYPHWVTQSDLSDKFNWDSSDGRWVATFAFFDPFAAS